MKKIISEIYETFRKPLLYFILKNVSNKSIAEDLLHEVFIKAYSNFDTLKEKEKIQSWLYMIARNTIIDYFRKKQISNIENPDLYFEETIQESVINDLSCCLQTLISKLPQKQKAVLEAVYFNEKSLIEYSDENNLNLSTAKSQSKRAKEKLKNIFNEFYSFRLNERKEIVDYQYKGDSCICIEKYSIE